MSKRGDAERKSERKLHLSTNLTALKAGPQFKPGASATTKWRARVRWENLASAYKNVLADVHPELRAWEELVSLVLEQFPEFEPEFNKATLKVLTPEALRRQSVTLRELRMKVSELQAENAALKKRLTQSAADAASSAYKRRR